MKKVVYAVLVVAVLVAGGLVAFYGPLDGNQNQSNDTLQQANDQNTHGNTSQNQAQEGINFSNNGKTATYSGQEGKDALSILKSLTKVETQSSDLGEFVTEINGIKADPKTEFWAFYVNGQLADKGAGSYQTKDTDTIEWKLEKINP